MKLTVPSHPKQPRNRAAWVVKIAPSVKVEQEKANYDRFVGSVLPAEFRPELLGFADAHDFGALCYSCVSTPARAVPHTLTEHLNQGNTRALALVLGKICRLLGRSWYEPAATRHKQCIADRYERRFFNDRSSILTNEAKLARDAARYFGAETQGARIAIDHTVFPSPATMLFDKFKLMSYRCCVIHGDLNSDNIIVSPNRGLVNLIDFEHVGEGHVYEDLVSIEASIRINHPQDASFAEILEHERLIAENCPSQSDDVYAQAIMAVRRTATRLFGSIEDASRYHFAVAAVGLRLMQAVDLQDFARARITASTLWATRALAQRHGLWAADFRVGINISR